MTSGGRWDQLSQRVIGLAIEVHKGLGPGLIESAYEHCLCLELDMAGLQFGRQVPVQVEYKGRKVGEPYKIDVIVEDRLLLELKSVDKLGPIHQAQILTYMRLSGIRTGLLVNFNVTLLKDGIKRFVL